MVATRQKFLTMVGRAALLKCPWCGSRRTFVRGWFRRYDRCRTCGVGWRREEGFELGTITVNTVITFSALALAMGIGLVLTVPDVPVFAFVVSLLVVAAVVPVLIYPFTYTLWLALDFAVHPPERAELDRAAAAVASGDAAAGVPLPSNAQRRKRST